MRTEVSFNKNASDNNILFPNSLMSEVVMIECDGCSQLMGLGTTITSEPFLVLRRLDILNEPSLHTAAKLNLNKRSPGLCFCMFGKLTADFVVDKTGHLPGDDIVISAEINNECRQNVKTIQVYVNILYKTNIRSTPYPFKMHNPSLEKNGK